MHTDPISDYLTRIRNAISAGHKVVEIPASKLKVEITKVLEDQGFIMKYKIEEKKPQSTIKIALKYDKATNSPVIKGLHRISKPGLRKYTNVKTLPRVKNSLGIAVISTSKGIMTEKAAKKQNIGGEVLCYVY